MLIVYSFLNRIEIDKPMITPTQIDTKEMKNNSRVTSFVDNSSIITVAMIMMLIAIDNAIRNRQNKLFLSTDLYSLSSLWSIGFMFVLFF